MNGPVSQRRVRQVVQTQGKALQGVLPAIEQLAHNEQVTRKRLESHEARLDSHEAFEMRTLTERLKWLFTGR